MDLYFQAAAVLLAGAALAYLIYVMMTPAQIFAPMIENTLGQVEERTTQVQTSAIETFHNATNVQGTEVLELIHNATSYAIAVFVQTCEQKGLIVNYGYQLRPRNATAVTLGGYGSINSSATEFEKNSVTTVRGLFRGGPTFSESTSYPRNGSLAAGPYGTASLGSDRYAALTVTTAVPPTATNSPLLGFFDHSLANYGDAAARKSTYSNSGNLYTAQVLIQNIPTNDNLSYARNRGSVYYINPGSLFNSAWIIDQFGDVVGVYVEEHKVDTRGNILASAMLATGMLSVIPS